MAGPIKLKLGGTVEGMGENVLAKEYFGSVKVDPGSGQWATGASSGPWG